jgi:tRNA(Met) C34 N-acetyltransferase TmcA
MSVKEFSIEEGSEQFNFLMCRDDIAGYTGGYGNGKTAALGVSAIQIASQYENARVLVGRATRPQARRFN